MVLPPYHALQTRIAVVLLLISGCSSSRLEPVVTLTCLQPYAEVIRGQSCERVFEFRNHGTRKVSLRQVTTSCGCALVEPNNPRELSDVGFNESIRFHVRIDTSQRLGPLSVGLMVEAVAPDGQVRVVKGSVSMFVNPGWVTDKRACMFRQIDGKTEKYEESFSIFATTPNPTLFHSISVSSSDPAIEVQVEDVEESTESHTDECVVDTQALVGKKLHLRAVAVCRLRADVTDFHRRDETVTVEFGNELVPLIMPIHFQPVKQLIACEPARITLADTQLHHEETRTEVLVRTDFPLEDLAIEPSRPDIVIVSAESLIDGVYRVVVEFKGSFEGNGTIRIRSTTAGDSKELPITVIPSQR